MLALVNALGDSAVIGTVMPLLVALVVRSHWAGWLKAAVAVAASLLAGTLGAWAAGQLAGLPWALAVIAALAASQAAYRSWWHATGIAQCLEQISSPKVIDGEVVASSTEPAAAAVDSQPRV